MIPGPTDIFGELNQHILYPNYKNFERIKNLKVGVASYFSNSIFIDDMLVGVDDFRIKMMQRISIF